MQTLSLHCLKIDRVILATDANPDYIQLWPVAAKAWHKITGLRPTLALIAEKSVTVDESLGDVIRFEPIPGMPTSLQAQLIRLLLPAYFEQDGCIISDIDMIPCSKAFFIESVANIPADHFVVYHGKVCDKFPMCYVAAQGKTFKQVFNINRVEDIPAILKYWHSFNLGWTTDEQLLTYYVENWESNKTRCTLLNYAIEKRVDRANWRYSSTDVMQQYYRDAHLPRPYNKYKNEIDQLVSYLDLMAPASSAVQQSAHKAMVVIIPSYNNSQIYKQNLNSVLGQRYDNFRVIYIDDCSPDGTGDLVERYVQELNLGHRVRIVKNKERLGAMANMYHAVHSCDDSAIVVALDGDDWFAHSEVLATVNEHYMRNDIWLTYGQLQFFPFGPRSPYKELPKEVIDNHSYRAHDWSTTALRTFYAWLFKAIRKEDLVYGPEFAHAGKFFTVTHDFAYMFPMLEMAGHRSKFIAEILYTYNLGTSMNDHTIRRQEQEETGWYIRGKPKYALLDRVPDYVKLPAVEVR